MPRLLDLRIWDGTQWLPCIPMYDDQGKVKVYDVKFGVFIPSYGIASWQDNT